MISKFLSKLLAFAAVIVMMVPVAAAAVPESEAQMQLSFAPVVKQVSPAVVNIYTKRTVSKSVRSPFMRDPFFEHFFGNNFFGRRMRKQVESALGSGVIIQADGLIVTNAHVIKDAQEITVALKDGQELEAKLVIADEASDLALLRVDPQDMQLPFVTLKPSETLEVGDLVLAVGNPFGVGQTVTSGIVSAQGSSALNINDFNFFIQTDAAINPGNSGGPLVTLDGGVVGINTAIYSRDGGSLGIGFAVPSEMVATLIAAEKNGQAGAKGVVRPWLGVTTQNVSSDIAESLDLDRPKGALIVDLHQASPLKKAGLKVGDLVLSLDGKDIRDQGEMRFRMATVPLGETARIEILRGDVPMSFDVRAIAPPDVPDRDARTLKGSSYLEGATIANINPAVSVELGLRAAAGVVVLDIAQGAPAARVVAVGDVLREINGRVIETSRDVEKALKESGRGISLILERNGHKRQIILR